MSNIKDLHGLSGNELYRDVVHYSNMGDHRTGSLADLKTSDWIYQELNAIGYQSEFLNWNFRQFFIEDCWVEVYGQRLKSFPLWYPKAIGEKPLRAKLVAIESVNDYSSLNGEVPLIRFDDEMMTPDSQHESIINQLAIANAPAVIGYYPHESGELYGHNAFPPFNQRPWPIPVVMIAAKDQHVIAHAAGMKDEVKIMLSGRDDADAEAKGVLARLEKGNRWIIVSTPQSGWFRSAGERGTGLALFLGLARWSSREKNSLSYLFMSNPGHEIGHIGMHESLKRGNIPSPEQVLCWVHLGASIATRGWTKEGPFLKSCESYEKKSWLLSNPELIPVLEKGFEELPHLTPKEFNLKRGELRWILENGYSGFALMGPHQAFHLESDGPEVTGPELLEPVAKAIAKTLLAVGNP